MIIIHGKLGKKVDTPSLRATSGKVGPFDKTSPLPSKAILKYQKH